jgi:hypothetical protein
MDMLTNIGDQLMASFVSIWAHIVLWSPRVIGAVVILLVGMWLASMLKGLVKKLLDLLKIDDLAGRVELNQKIQAVGLTATVAQMLSGLVYWLVFLIFLSASSSALGVEVVTNFIGMMIGYIPSILAGLAVMGIGVLVADSLSKIMENVRLGHTYKMVVRWFILVIAFITAIEQIGIDVSFLAGNIQLLVGGAALALGLAFGMGGKDHAKAFLDKHLS